MIRPATGSIHAPCPGSKRSFSTTVYEGRLRAEAVFGGKPLRWAYENRAGAALSRGGDQTAVVFRSLRRWADTRRSAKEIAPFIARFGVDPAEFLDPPESFRSFNEFFYRRLRPESRPLAPGADTVVFPADGRHLLIPDLSANPPSMRKAAGSTLATFLGDPALAERFAGGSAILSRLCPTDYHRFHFPLEGNAASPRLINGSLYSVNPIALSRSLRYLHENKRRVTEIRNARVGSYLFLEIGATNVGSIVDTAAPGPVTKGGEKGYFRFGGSMVATLFPRGVLLPEPDLPDNRPPGSNSMPAWETAWGRSRTEGPKEKTAAPTRGTAVFEAVWIDSASIKARRSSSRPTHLEQAASQQLLWHSLDLQAPRERAPTATMTRRMMFFMVWWYSGLVKFRINTKETLEPCGTGTPNGCIRVKRPLDSPTSKKKQPMSRQPKHLGRGGRDRGRGD